MGGKPALVTGHRTILVATDFKPQTPARGLARAHARAHLGREHSIPAMTKQKPGQASQVTSRGEGAESGAHGASIVILAQVTLPHLPPDAGKGTLPAGDNAAHGRVACRHVGRRPRRAGGRHPQRLQHPRI